MSDIAGTPISPMLQMLQWIEECERAAKDHDVPRLVTLLSVINAKLDTEFARTRKNPVR